MSDLISYLATRLGLHPEGFSAGGFLAECCAGKEPHHNCVYEGIKLVLGERSKNRPVLAVLLPKPQKLLLRGKAIFAITKHAEKSLA